MIVSRVRNRGMAHGVGSFCGVIPGGVGGISEFQDPANLLVPINWTIVSKTNAD